MEFCERHNIVPRLALHEIAQLNFSKELYKETQEIPQLEYRIVQHANRNEIGSYRKNYCELDVVSKMSDSIATFYEVKPMGRSVKSQIETYKMMSGFNVGEWMGVVNNIEIISLKDYKICMEIMGTGGGAVYYTLYNSVSNEKITNKEFVKIYESYKRNEKQQYEADNIHIEFPSIEDLLPEVLFIALSSVIGYILDNVDQVLELVSQEIIPYLG